MAKGKYDAIRNFLEYSEKELGVRIYIKDYVDFIGINDELVEALSGHLVHNTPYCLYIKSDSERYIRCTSMMDGIIKKLTREPKAYCGMCYAGIMEYICPIIFEGQLIGSVHAGDFAVPERYSRFCIGKTGADFKKAFTLYNESVSKAEIEIDRLKPHLEMIAFSIAQLFTQAAAYGEYSQLRTSTVLFRNDVVSEALEYIRQHFTEQVPIGSIAEHCHCSISCLSHVFKGHVKMSISAYIIKIRIDSARELLTETHKSVAEIAHDTGFSDPNYFSRVFTRCVGLTPRQYRTRFTKEYNEST